MGCLAGEIREFGDKATKLRILNGVRDLRVDDGSLWHGTASVSERLGGPLREAAC